MATCRQRPRIESRLIGPFADKLRLDLAEQHLLLGLAPSRPMPPSERAASTPWPLWPLMLRQESSHEEGGVREWAVATVKFTGDENGNVKQLHAIRVSPPPKFEPIAGTEFTLDADLVLLAMGFTGPVKSGLIGGLRVELDNRGNVKTENYQSANRPRVFAAGDARRGQSPVVWAIREGREASRAIGHHLMGNTLLQ